MASTWPGKKKKKQKKNANASGIGTSRYLASNKAPVRDNEKERKKDKIITKMFCCELSIQRNVVVRLYMYDQKRLQFALDDLARFQISGGNS